MPDADLDKEPTAPPPEQAAPPGEEAAPPGEEAAPPGEQAPPAPAARKRRGYFLPGAIALAALLLIGGAIGAGDLSHPAPRTLRGTDTASQISLGVQEQQNDPTPPQVICPPSEPVKAGLRFACTLVDAGGRAVPVAVTEVDGRGRLHWSLGVAAPAK